MKKILVIGMGKVGSLVGTLLGKQFEVTGLDKKQPAVALNFPIVEADVTDLVALQKNMNGFDAVVSCMPYNLNLPIAQTAYALGIHYFDLTEDVPTTAAIREMARDSKGDYGTSMRPRSRLYRNRGSQSGSKIHETTRYRTTGRGLATLSQWPDGVFLHLVTGGSN